ncbi:hypothetical protein HWB90_gp090 [Mycobacterium phage Fowlmouth]|uniref:Uncharacterized protein n=2 Tax=Fowlmouthvirus fowlmouth TaxID=2845652 RepID=A0A7G8LPY9_9CAUD|nr:hypothetical protein HWB90_gp090 [Mycobacterium phage Fowlmouth]AYN58049.1 hypothetical protein SEA_FOWLMOUTH_100 [Mycobacterium phage Fowlmouth]QNJ59311.1 hypothetical protein SEA_MRMIYAGI_98 [Mycobacterium phage MrMiyagi]
MDGSKAISMMVIVAMDCEECERNMPIGSECQIAGPSDIRMVCMNCFERLNS